jgi:hypothetical protein
VISAEDAPIGNWFSKGRNKYITAWPLLRFASAFTREGEHVFKVFSSRKIGEIMKHITTVVLTLSLGVAGVYAQDIPVKMTFSGTNVATLINLQPNTVTDEQHSAGNGTFGAFAFRELHADGPIAQQPSSSCSGPNFATLAGTGVFRFQDGSLLIVAVKDGSGCINPAAGTAAITVNYEITGGTGRFEGASGSLTLTATLRSVLRNASNASALLTLTGVIEGTVSGQP